jgi:hypothetical protein
VLVKYLLEIKLLGLPFEASGFLAHIALTASMVNQKAARRYSSARKA